MRGDIIVSDLYSNTQMMAGETLAGLGSSAAILYYNDVVTYPDNTTESTDLLLAALPHATNAAFDAIANYPFSQKSYQRLYDVYNQMRAEDTPLSEPAMVGFNARAKVLYDQLRQRQKQYPQRLAEGKTLDALAEETWQLLCADI